MNNIAGALNAYQQALSRINKASEATTIISAENEAPKNNFQNMVTTALNDAQNMTRSAEEASLAGIAGKADIQDVVLAVSNAEVALETVVAVRDTAIKAYEEIMRMTI